VGIAVLAGAAAVWAAAHIPALSDAAFVAGFEAQVEASGAIDIAQGEDEQYDDPEDPSTLETTDRAIHRTARNGSPRGETTEVKVPIINQSPQAEAEISVVVENRTGDKVFDHLRFSVAAEDGDAVPEGSTVPSSWFDEHPEGLLIPEPLPSGEETTLTIKVWLASTAPESALGQDVELSVRVTGETIAPESPIILDAL
jgi:hypothetical protein